MGHAIVSLTNPQLHHIRTGPSTKQLSGTGKNKMATTSSADDDGKTPRPRILLGSGAFHLEANRTRLLAGAMREHFGDAAPKLLFIPYAAADGDYDAYVKRTIELVRLGRLPTLLVVNNHSNKMFQVSFDPRLPKLTRKNRAWTAGTSSTRSTCTPTPSRPSARPRASTSVRLAPLSVG